MPEVEVPPELLEQLWREPKARSRNTNFARFRDDKVYRTAVKHVRSLLSFVRDVERYRHEGDVTVSWHASGRQAKVTLWVPSLRLRRSLYISDTELELLRRHPVWRETEIEQ